MLADPGELPTILGLGVTGEPLLALRTALWPSPIWQLVAEELLESFTVVLERNRFRPGVETSPEHLAAPSAETAPVPAAASVRNLSNTFFRNTSNRNAIHVPFFFSRH